MRKFTLLAAAITVVGCAKEEAPPVDSAATATPPATTPAPLTAADLAGTWMGETKLAGTDSVVSRFTAVRTDDTRGKLAIQGSPDSVAYTVAYDADSMMVTSEPYTDPANPKGPKIMFRSVGRLVGANLVGTGITVLADKPDSVVARTTWTAMRHQ